MRRLSLIVVVLALAAAAPTARAQAPSLGTWDLGDQHLVTKDAILAPADGGFHGERTLTTGQLSDALTALAARFRTSPVAVPSGRVTVARFDQVLVEQLGLADVAAAVRLEARRAGLRPPAIFGSEVVARQLALRFNHPSATESLELFPWDTITRAEAAYSLAQILRWDGSEPAYARAVLARFVLPRMTAAELRPLRLAVSKIGMPYVWGGETDDTRGADGYQAHGGYDCSGFAWRVFKLSGNPAGRKIDNRTAAGQASEIPRSSRIHLADVHPADLLFFGPAGFHSPATEAGIVHEGIALSKDFMINASGQGVFVAPLFEEWRLKEFSWARRVV